MATESTGKDSLSRRSFLYSSAAAGVGMMTASGVQAQLKRSGGKDTVKIALLGCGAQGQRLRDAFMAINDKDLKIVAVCDIWEKFNLRKVSKQLEYTGHPNKAYTDYKEMLDTEKDLDAVIVATPDFWHAEHTIACLKKGLHVYCEKEMSNTIEGARQMVQASKETGKLLQIGHQRRSNPAYLHSFDNIINGSGMLGRITTVNGQWNRCRMHCEDLTVKEKYNIDPAILKKYGYKDMQQFLNWRWYKGKGGGPIVDLGSHQIDIYSWFLQCEPSNVIASGGTDYWTDHEWYDNVMCVYEYKTKAGPVRAFYQTTTTNSNGGYFESFMGDVGTLTLSEPKGSCTAYLEPGYPKDHWDKWVAKDYIKKYKEAAAKQEDETAAAGGTKPVIPFELGVQLKKFPHQPHLENFFGAVRGKAKLTCPGEEAFKSCVTVHKVNEAVDAGKKLDFKHDEFKV